MATAMDQRFESLLETSPSFLTAKDLVVLGLYPTKVALYKAKGRGDAPPSIEISDRKLRFPKNDLLRWLESRKKDVTLSA